MRSSAFAFVGFPSRAIALVFMVVATHGCGDLATASQAGDPIHVSAVEPAEGDQGQTLYIRILGEGFAEGDAPTWEREGVPDPLITVDDVILVSSTELRARISIALTADAASYDVAVNRDRKKGIGTEDDRAVAPDAFVVNEYTPHPLGFIPQSIGEGLNYTEVYGVNDHGVLVGRDGCCAFRWSEGEGMVRMLGEGSQAKAINNKGWIVGLTGSSDGSWGSPFVFQDGVVVVLDTLDYRSAQANAINDAGTIAGMRLGRPVVQNRSADGSYGAPVELSLPEVQGVGELLSGWAISINERGDIIGTLEYEAGPGLRHVGVVWQARDGGHREPLVLDGRGVSTFVSAINDDGWIVGHTHGTVFDRPVAVLWHPADYTRAIPLGSQTSFGANAFDINNTGQVAGVRFDDTSRATLWQLDADGNTAEVIPLLPASRYSDSHAKVVNAHGWVFGFSRVWELDRWTTEVTLWRPDK
jgi:uncharacterized membrane protein